MAKLLGALVFVLAMASFASLNFAAGLLLLLSGLFCFFSEEIGSYLGGSHGHD